MMERAFAIIHLPPKGKARPRICGRRAFMPKDYTDWKKNFGKQWPRPVTAFDQTIHVETHFFTKTGNSRSDMDNAHAAVLDALQDAGIIVNDRQVKSGAYSLSKGFSDYIEVTIRPIAS
jgi:Holliday junction resolvase RusA-like endonuclease